VFTAAQHANVSHCLVQRSDVCVSRGWPQKTTPFTTHHDNAAVKAEVIFIENVHRIYTAEAGQHHFRY